MKDLVLISKQNFVGIPNKNNRQNKHRKFYEWQLSRFINDPGFGNLSVDILPRSPYETGIQRVKSEIITELNSRNLFDFSFSPAEQDTLHLTNEKEYDDHLLLRFLNGKWDDFTYPDMTFSEEYRIIHSGKFEL